jgi:hypothetical protein
VAVLAVLPFLPALDGEFLHWDDDVNFLNNPGYRGLGPRHLAWMLTTTLSGHYIPLTWLTLGLDFTLGGMDPWGYHLANLLLHGAGAALMYRVSRRLLAAALGVETGGSDLPLAAGAAVSALAFAVHPLRVESVAWITERRDVLCGVFYLLAVLAYLRGTAAGGTLRGRDRVLSLAAFAAALLSKSMAMTLPLTLLVLDLYPLGRRRLGWRALLGEKIPHAVLAALGAAVAVWAVGRSAGWTSYATHGALDRVAMTVYSFWFYPSSMVWPVSLSPLYELPIHIDVLEWRFVGSALGLAAVTITLVALRRRFPGGLAAWAHSVIVLAPVSGFVHAGNQLAHDRYSYLSGLGFAVLLGGAVSWAILAGRRGRLRGWVPAAIGAAAALVLLGWSAGTWRQSGAWHDSEALWRSAVASDPGCAICRNNLSGALVVSRPSDNSAMAEAEGRLLEAIVLRPEYPDAYRNLVALYTRQGRAREAETVSAAMARALPGLAASPKPRP